MRFVPIVAAAAVALALAGAGSIPVAHAVVACRSSRLLVTSASAGNSAAHRYLEIIFINRGSRCSLTGFPGVSAISEADATHPVQLGPSAGRAPNPLLGRRARRVVLEHDGTASSLLTIVSTGPFAASTCRPVKADALRVYVPDERNAVVLDLPTEVCRRFGVLVVAPVEPGVPYGIQLG